MPREIIYVYEVIIFPTIKLIVKTGFAPVEIAKFIESGYTKKVFLENDAEIFINLASVKSFKLIEKYHK